MVTYGCNELVRVGGCASVNQCTEVSVHYSEAADRQCSAVRNITVSNPYIPTPKHCGIGEEFILVRLYILIVQALFREGGNDHIARDKFARCVELDVAVLCEFNGGNHYRRGILPGTAGLDSVVPKDEG